MAEIRPFRAFRYNDRRRYDIEKMVSPLFDVVSAKQRDALYQQAFNSIHLSVPLGPAPHVRAKKLLAEWKAQKVIVQDGVPGFYIYYQYFSLPNQAQQLCRKGFIGMIRAYDFEEKVILRHENTIPLAVNDRERLLGETELHVSPTHGLYTDPTFELEGYMDEAMEKPIYKIEDYQGVTDALGVITDKRIIGRFVEVLRRKQVILADGHHRYEGSVAYRKSQTDSNPHHTGKEGYNYHMMWLTNTEAHDLRILPTHRLIDGLPPFDIQELLKRTAAYFHIKPVENPYDLNEIILGKKWAFGLVFQDTAVKIRLKPEVFEQLSWPFPLVVKEVDLTVLHYFFIEKVLGIKGKYQRASEQISFERNYTSCITKVATGKAQLALITNEISIEQVKKVCYSGYTLPQKSTFFYPKVVCGFVFGSVKTGEFEHNSL